MPPAYALFLCTVFVLFLLRLARKQGPNVSRALWIPTIWMLYTGSKPLGIWFGSPGADIESGSPLDRAFLIGLFCLGLFVLAVKKLDWSKAIKENSWLMLLLGYMLVSVLWSDIQFISFKRWTKELIALIMAFIVLTEKDARLAVESILRRTVYILIPFSVLVIKYFPEYGREYGRWSGREMWIGVTLQKNGLGRLCLVAAFILIWTLARRWRGHDVSVVRYQTLAEVFVLILTLWLLKGTKDAYSATAVASLVVGLAFFFGLRWMRKRHITLRMNMVAIIMAFIICYGIVTPIIGGLFMGEFSSALGRDETLTGRTEIWASLVPAAMEHPILGSGFGGFWTTKSSKTYRIGEGHNGYLDVLLELGFVGLLLFSMFLLSCCRKALRVLAQDFDWGSLWLCFLLMTMVHNITESSMSSFSTQLMAILLFLAVSSPVANSFTAVGPRDVRHLST